MQISTNSAMQETSLAYQTAQKQQDNTASFDTLLSLQSNQDNNAGQKIQEESKQQLQDILDLKGSFMAFVGVAQAAMLESEKVYGSIDNGFDILRQWYKENNSKKIEKILESSISALEIYSNAGGYLDEFGYWSSKPQYLFEAQKSKAIDILSEILQGIKA